MKIFRLITVVIGLWLAWDLLAHLVGEILWFDEIGYLSVFLLRLQTQLGLWLVVSSLSATFLLSNLFVANRLKSPPPKSDLLSLRDYREWGMGKEENEFYTPRLRLRSLLLILLCLSFLVGIILLKCGEIAFALWQGNFSPDIAPLLPPPFDWAWIQELWHSKLPVQITYLGVVGFIFLGLAFHSRFWLNAIAILLSLFWGWLLSREWSQIWQYFYATPFKAKDPLFGNDISLYVFKLPVWQLLDFWLGGLFLFGLLAVALVYFLSGKSLSEGKFLGFSRNQLRHLYGLGSSVALTIAFRYWLSRYELLYSPRGVVYGASYTDINADLPIDTALSIAAFAIAIILFLKMVWGTKHLKIKHQTIVTILGLYLIIVIIAGKILPATIQSLVVQPNELAQEKLYLERTIALTRAGFNLDSIEVETFNPKGELSSTDLENNDLTISNIRLWDKRPILQTNRQLQQIRLYYEFPDADIDRYTLKVNSSINDISKNSEIDKSVKTNNKQTTNNKKQTNLEKQQTIISVRELDYKAVPEKAKTWVNQHLVYTHGYGFTLSPVNKVAEGGLPDYFIKDIGTDNDSGNTGSLSTSSPLIRETIPIDKPRIYYGELTNNYIMTSTKVRELDYPSGEDNVYNIYDGKGGIPIGSLWRRILFSQYLKDWRMILTDNFTPQTRVLFRRNINQRIFAIAPFLRYDRDPYIVIANPEENKIKQSKIKSKKSNNKGIEQIANKEQKTTNNYLYWIIDAYTTSNRYPYSDPGENQFNYIRNTVKIVIDAYNGNVTFYIADDRDPIIQTWTKIFPNLFQPMAAMPQEIKNHIRYPVDLFSVQSKQLMTYHMIDPQVFYNREDLWRIPQEIYGGESQAVAPYYLIMKLPSEKSEEFILLHPYTPASRTNLIAWLAARSDGDRYGKLLLYKFPKQEQIYGPEQIESLINQDPVISGQISLWTRQGSQAIQGNLLVIPIERSLLYVEPLYLEAEKNSLPTLVRVIVVYNNRILMAPTLGQALQELFGAEKQSTPTIIRAVEPRSLP
ncbi:MAG TPA: hypothetical protein DEG17_07820 [Cyanobacteria bacterium UBA11149]|nr:hypothetical protein [Cyanobacteria bacterium UBA11367]HBE60159.1 hypothetical protein [Cyanobacteria bacterium UBA11366]HBK64869.1 hypothetical protein [Cyanobacteria bacterium UBA11166]HBR75478.1 hypothetical protein [Cyanobacteria bacterium UBA11159]HBS70576.1 hypothetical protein [Cyanobacteria bacterium UBA11153]HBW88768.1 hypothetical protein [Cyanobacteria bacterium UBA11149]HCA98216.1 hypothetical protein [Cyanobacteria bacterium UBA9226]